MMSHQQKQNVGHCCFNVKTTMGERLEFVTRNCFIVSAFIIIINSPAGYREKMNDSINSFPPQASVSVSAWYLTMSAHVSRLSRVASTYSLT